MSVDLRKRTRCFLTMRAVFDLDPAEEEASEVLDWYVSLLRDADGCVSATGEVQSESSPYELSSPYEGAYNVIDAEDGERVARVARFMPGPMVLVEGPSITSPAIARAVAGAMVKLADEIDGNPPIGG